LRFFWVLVAGRWKARAVMQAPGSRAPPRPGRSIGGHHVRAKVGGHHWSYALAGRDAWSLEGVRAAQQGPALSSRSANRRGDHSRDACGGARPVCGPDAWADRGPVARWVADQRGVALTESDLDSKTGSVLVRAGKGGKRRMVGMDEWGWEHVARWTEHRVRLPIGPLFCILAGPTRGRGWSATAARGELRRLAAQAGVRRRFAPHQLRHAHAI
jgi:hypothetical protein